MHRKELEELKNNTVHSPKELADKLESLLTQDAAKSHYFTFKLGLQEIFLRADFSEKPYLLYYCDVEERAVSPAVRKTFADFLWEKGGEKEKYLNAPNQEEIRENFRNEGVKVFIPNVNIPDIYKKAELTIAERQGDLAPKDEKIGRLVNVTRAATMHRIAELAKQKAAPAAFPNAAAEKSGIQLFNIFSRSAKSDDTIKSTPKPGSTPKP